jgi:arsenate reductase
MPKGILFLCVGNSARSQMAEGIARSLAPPDIKIWSAGSRPTSVRPEAIAVLKEIEIDISSHRSKPLSEIPASEVGMVITLCAEEECPVFLGEAQRLHWGLPDPAAVAGSEAEVMAAFRTVRDELYRRVKAVLFDRTHEGRIPKMIIRILGTGCPNCKKLYAEAEKAIAESDVKVELEKVEEIEEIIKYGVMATPALVLNEEIKAIGRIPQCNEIVSWIEAAVKSIE